MELFTGVKREYHKNGTLYSENYYENGKKHRIGGPAEIWYYDNGIIYYETYYENGKIHRIGGPAFIEYYGNGKIYHEKYYENGKKHRIGGPAFIEYNDAYTQYIYYQEGKYYNPCGPTEFRLNPKNLIVYKDYYSKTGKMANIKGPAIIDTICIHWGIYGFNTVIDRKTF